MSTTVRVWFGAVFALLLIMAVACGTDDGTGVRTIDEGTGSASASGSGGSPSGTHPSGTETALDPANADTRVNITLNEWTITAQPAQVEAGVIAFDVKNEGSILHEVVVLRAPNVEALPVAADGTVDEEALGQHNSIGEIEVEADKTGAVAFQMEPGSYVLICNILDEDGHVHVKDGMHAPFTVT